RPAVPRHNELGIRPSHSSFRSKHGTQSAFLAMRVRRSLLIATSTDKIPETSRSKTEQVLGLPEVLLGIPSGQQPPSSSASDTVDPSIVSLWTLKIETFWFCERFSETNIHHQAI